MIVVFAFSPSSDFDPYSECESIEQCKGPTALVTNPSQTLHALPLFVFSYTCHQNIFSITNELSDPTPQRNIKVCVLAVGAALAVYIILGASGYSTFGGLVDHDILASYPSDNGIVAVARLAISLVVSCCYPLQAHPSRACTTSIVRACGGEDIDDFVLHMAITTVFVLASGSIALVVTDLGLILSVVGATGSTTVSYILPGACYFILFPERPSRWLGFLLACTGLIIMPLSLCLIFWK